MSPNPILKPALQSLSRKTPYFKDHHLMMGLKGKFPWGIFTVSHFLMDVTPGKKFYFVHATPGSIAFCEVESYVLKEILPQSSLQQESKVVHSFIADYCDLDHLGAHKLDTVENLITSPNGCFLVSNPENEEYARNSANNYKALLVENWEKLIDFH